MRLPRPVVEPTCCLVTGETLISRRSFPRRTCETPRPGQTGAVADHHGASLSRHTYSPRPYLTVRPCVVVYCESSGPAFGACSAAIRSAVQVCSPVVVSARRGGIALLRHFGS